MTGDRSGGGRGISLRVITKAKRYSGKIGCSSPVGENHKALQNIKYANQRKDIPHS